MGLSIRLLFFVGLLVVAVSTYFSKEWYFKIPVWSLIVVGCHSVVNFVAKD